MRKQQAIYDYTDFEKQKLGLLIGYYRKQCNMSYKEIRKANGPAPATIMKLEKGIIIKSDYIYDDCLELFSKKYIRKMNFQSWLEQFLPKLEKALEFHDIKELENLEHELEQEFSEYKISSIYSEYYQVIHSLFQYNLYNQYLSLDEFNHMHELLKMDFLEKILKIYLVELLYIVANNVLCDYDKLMELSEVMKGLENNPIIMYLLANKEKCNSNLQTALDIYQKLENYWNDRENQYRKTKILMGLFTIYKITDNSKANECATKLIKIKNCEYDCVTMVNINFNVGMFYYYNNKYDDAYELFCENIYKYETKKEWLYIGTLSTLLKKELPDEILTVDLSDEPTKEYIEYFKQKKKNVSEEELAHYIMDKLIPYKLKHYKSKEPYWSIFEKEMLELAKKSKTVTKLYIKYMENIERYLKKAE